MLHPEYEQAANILREAGLDNAAELIEKVGTLTADGSRWTFEPGYCYQYSSSIWQAGFRLMPPDILQLKTALLNGTQAIAEGADAGTVLARLAELARKAA
jgi:hypothetical protein